MNDATLFAIGCGVSFFALGGFYVYVRDRVFHLSVPAPAWGARDLVEPVEVSGDSRPDRA